MHFISVAVITKLKAMGDHLQRDFFLSYTENETDPKKPHANYLENCSILKCLIIFIKQYYLLRVFCCCPGFCWNMSSSVNVHVK